MPTPSPSRSVGFSAMTYNILSGARKASDFPQVSPADISFAHRAPVLGSWIRFANPDILAIQENEPMRAPTYRPIRRLMPLLPGYGVVQADSDVPILYRKKAFEALDSGVRLISRRRHLRYGTWCRLRHRASGLEILAANTHLDPHQSPAVIRIREESLRVLMSWLAEVNARRQLPMMLLGDLNTLNDYDTSGRVRGLGPLYDSGLRNSVDVAVTTVSEVPEAASFNVLGDVVDGKWRYGAIRQDGRTIDYVWVSRPFDVRTWQVVTGPGVRVVDGTSYFASRPVPSDHCPVMVEVSLPLG